MIRALQFSQTGASLWMAHSKLSNVYARPSRVTSKLRSYSLPQVSHRAINAPLLLPLIRCTSHAIRSLGRPRVARHREGCSHVGRRVQGCSHVGRRGTSGRARPGLLPRGAAREVRSCSPQGCSHVGRRGTSGRARPGLLPRGAARDVRSCAPRVAPTWGGAGGPVVLAPGLLPRGAAGPWLLPRRAARDVRSCSPFGLRATEALKSVLARSARCARTRDLSGCAALGDAQAGNKRREQSRSDIRRFVARAPGSQAAERNRTLVDHSVCVYNATRMRSGWSHLGTTRPLSLDFG